MAKCDVLTLQGLVIKHMGHNGEKLCDNYIANNRPEIHILQLCDNYIANNRPKIQGPFLICDRI